MEHTSSFNTVDLTVLGVLALSGIVAFMRGLVREVFSLGAWVGASFITAFAYPLAKPWVHSQIKNEMAADGATAAGLFCLALIVLIPLGNLVAGLVKGRTLTAIDRSLGFVFGLVRGFLVVCLLYLIMAWVWPEKDKLPEWLAEAKTQPLLAYGADNLKDMFPEKERKHIEETLNKDESLAKNPETAIKALEMMSRPEPKAKEVKAPAYDNDERDKMNQFIDQKGKP